MREWWQVLPVAGWMLVLAIQPWGPVIGLAFAVIGCLWLAWCWKSCRRIAQEEQEEQSRQFLTLWSRQRHDWMNHIQILMAYASMKQVEKITSHLQTLASEIAAERAASRVQCPSLALFLSTLRVKWMEWKTEVMISPDVSVLDGAEARRIEFVLHHVMDWITGLAPTKDIGELWIHLDKEESKSVLIRLEGEPETWPEWTESDWIQLSYTMDPWKVCLEPQEQGLTVRVPI